MKIFIDFDDVIFNTDLFKKRLSKIFCKNGISKKEFENSYRQFKKQKILYSPTKHIKLLIKDKNCGHILYSDILKFLKDLKLYIFKDAKEFLSNCPKNNLYLLSYGDLKFQKQKIKGAGISKYFKRVIITNKSKIEIIKKIAKRDRFSKLERIIFIDDKSQNIEEVKRKNIITIQLMRSADKSTLSKKADFKAKNFREIKKSLRNFRKDLLY